MPEACQNAALYFNPYDTRDIAAKIALILENDLLRKEMSEKSLIRSKELPDYNEITFKTLDIMKELINK